MEGQRVAYRMYRECGVVRDTILLYEAISYVGRDAMREVTDLRA